MVDGPTSPTILEGTPFVADGAGKDGKSPESRSSVSAEKRFTLQQINSLSHPLGRKNIRETRDPSVNDEIKRQKVLDFIKVSPQQLAAADKMAQIIFGNPLEDLTTQQIAIFDIDYANPSTKYMFDIFVATEYPNQGKSFDTLSVEEKAELLKKYVYEKAQDLTKNFLSVHIYGKSFDNLEDGEKMLVKRRERRLAGLAQMNEVILERVNISMEEKPGASEIRGKYISSGERFCVGVVEREDVMSFLIFGVPLTELSEQESAFLQEHLVSDLEESMGIYSASNFLEDKDFRIFAGKIWEVREAYYDRHNLPKPEGYSIGRVLVNPKRPAALRTLEGSGRKTVVRELEGPINLTAVVRNGDTKIVKQLVEMIQDGYSQEEALMVVDARLFESTRFSSVGQGTGAFLLEQKMRNDGQVEAKWSNVGDSVILVISDEGILYYDMQDPAGGEHLGSQDYPAYISTAHHTFPKGSEIVVLPREIFVLLNEHEQEEFRKRLFTLIEASYGTEQKIDIGELNKKLKSQGLTEVHKIVLGRTSSGEPLQSLIEKEEYSQEEVADIERTLRQFFEAFPKNSSENTRVSVEAAHLYADQSYALDHALGAQIGAITQRLLKSLGFQPETTFFIDNYNTSIELVRAEKERDRSLPDSLNPIGQEFRRKIDQRGYAIERIVWEADFVPLAQEALEKLTQAGLVEKRTDGIFLEEGSVKLFDQRGKPVCAFLDALRCVGELARNGCAINIVPEFYENEQRNMRTIIKALGYDTERVVSIIFDTEQVTVMAEESTVGTVKNEDVNWDEFNPYLYVAENYAQILPPDREILENLVGFYRENPPRGRFLEVGGGPNIYPILAALPDVDSVDIVEYGGRNITYLQEQLVQLDDTWQQWINLLKQLDPKYDIDFTQQFREKVHINQGSILDLPQGVYDAASMHFVSESMSEDLGEFDEANRKFIGSLRQGGIFVASFMENSQGYSSPGRPFPAVAISSNDIQNSLGPLTKDLTIKRISSGGGVVRAGHTGMISTTGHAN